MCATFYISKEELEEICKEAQDNVAKHEMDELQYGDIYPKGKAPILLENSGSIVTRVGSWGYPKNDGTKNVYFNSRSDVVTKRRTFTDSFLKSRCVVPALAYYEYTRQDLPQKREKYFFEPTDNSILFFAGFYKLIEDELRFIVMTADVHEQLEDLHDRMPLILNESEVYSWITDINAAQQLRYKEPVFLARRLA